MSKLIEKKDNKIDDLQKQVEENKQQVINEMIDGMEGGKQGATQMKPQEDHV